jgi:mRNA-degrading endonuclease toxin of MazEF toxin-antitoxin module
MISGNVRLASKEPTQILIDPATAEGRGSGLRGTSAVKCENLFTVSQNDILRTIGALHPSLMQRVDAALKSSLDLP